MNDQEKHIVDNSTFIKVWAVLIALTAVTITAAKLNLGRFSMLTALVIASLKASFVLWYFMHLKYENRFFKLLLFAPIVTLTVIIGLTFLDVLYR